ncbi:hypothetical protein [Burkholderia mayonis]|uniref:Uncharacterized protein n=1 Tax=Burkholderia mayonis TaxID=1385591 RepID=A0A1B4G3L2_9BURK|nr:hypothetical protein [Burkholderia mayonis]AOJ10507.1 hypothetical protein WS71_25265 [Burkholderia mayonis]KVE53512.1 hypothetical protein WS71_05510 [Burkholderia mayonis]
MLPARVVLRARRDDASLALPPIFFSASGAWSPMLAAAFPLSYSDPVHGESVLPFGTRSASIGRAPTEPNRRRDSRHPACTDSRLLSKVRAALAEHACMLGERLTSARRE